MNIFYGLALIALEGELFVNQFSEDKISNPEILDFMKKITAEVDPKIESLGHEFRHMASIELITNDDKKFSHTEKFRKGSPENPLTKDQILSKFKSLAAYSYDENKINKIKEKIENIELSNSTENLIN
jgi:2-methylcitrate dehydratase PrpD